LVKLSVNLFADLQSKLYNDRIGLKNQLKQITVKSTLTTKTKFDV